ncbi:hypothetical protein MMC17_006991 [Xylographa soralifera]|nr:hypothetical protein [Xylographa soralifera]
MPREVSAQINGNASTLSKLASFLESAKEITGQISIHPSLNTAVARVIKLGRPLSANDIAALVQVLDSTEPSLCSRLGYREFVSIFAILRLSDPSWTQQRGLWLLTEALHDIELETEKLQSVASSLGNLPSLSRKACIGREILRLSLTYFRNSLVAAGARRWTGLLALALLKDCEENVKLALRETEEDRYMLGWMVIGEQNEILRFIAGSIIRQLANEGAPQDLFWPDDGGIALRTNFFESQLDSSQWPELLEGYLDEMDSQLKNHEQKFTPFSYLLQLGGKAYSDTAPSFLVTLDGQLSIIIPELTTTSGTRKSSQYVDVPINNISRVEIQEVPVDTPTSSAERYVRFAVIVHLLKIDDYTMFVNAEPQSYPFLRLAFDDRNVADTLKHLILGLQDQGKTDNDGLSGSENPPTRNEVIESDDQHDVSPSPVQRNVPRRKIRGDWSLSDLAERFEPIDEMDSMVGDGTKLGLVATATSANRILDKDTPLYSVVSYGEERLRNRDYSPEHKIEMIGRVSQSVREKPREGKVFRRIEAEATGILATQGTRSPLDIVATSSAQWRDGVKAIDNAPELASQIHANGYTASFLSQPGETGARLRAEMGAIFPTGSRQLQIVNDNLDIEPSDTTAVEGTNIIQLPTRLTESTASRKRKASKVRQRLLNRDGEQIEVVEIGEEATRAKKYSKSTKGDSINDNDMPVKKSLSKKKITYATATKPANHVVRVSQDAESGDLAGEDDVFAIPDSPTRPSKSSAKTKQKKTVPKKAKSTKSKRLSKSAKVKPVLGVATIPVPKKAPASKRARASPKGAFTQENIQDSEALIGGGNRDMHQDEELNVEVEENPLITTNNENYSARMSKKSPKQVARGVLKGLGSDTKTNEPSNTEISDSNTAIASNSRHPDLVVPRRQLPKRMAAVHANQKLQGLKSDRAEVDTKEKLNYDGVTPESREHVRRSDKARQKLERSALEAGPSLLAKSQPSTFHNKDKNRLEQSPTDQTMAPSKGDRHTEAKVDMYRSTISNPPNPLLTTSSRLSRHSIERPDGDFHDLHQAQGTDINKPVVSFVEQRSLEESVDLIAACKMPHTSDEILENHFEQALEFTGGDDEISFADTHEPEAPTTGQSPQLQNIKTPSNLETGCWSAVDKGSHPTSISGVGHIPMTTPTIIPPPTNSTSPGIRTVQNSSTKVASNSMKSKSALPVHDIPAASPQLQHGEIQTSTHSSRHVRPVHDHLIIIKPADSVQNAILDTKPPHKVPEEKENETNAAVKLKLERQKSKPYTIGPVCERPLPTTNDNICETATIQGLVDATISPPASKLIEISSSVEASLEEDFGVAQKWSKTGHTKERVSSKRKSDGLASSVTKKIRADTTTGLSKPHNAAKPTEQPIGLENIVVEATDDRVQRKTIIIGFDLNGPRNQGISSPHKPHAETQLSVPKAPVLIEVQPSSRKRKYIEEQQTIDHSFGPQRAEDAPIKKLRSTILAVPPTPQAIEKLNVQISTTFQNPIVRQLSSQRSRVQENGSPAATRSRLPKVNSVDNSHLVDNMVDNLGNDNSVGTDFDRVVKQVDLGHDFGHEVDLPRKKPLPFQQQLPSILKGINKPSLKVEKLLPSSPNAIPWISADVANYYEQTDGNLVNFEMEDVIHVAKISDPFSDMNQNQTNPFIEMLRATGGAGKGITKPNTEDIDFTLHEKGVKYIGPVDPDKTLVEPERRRRRRNTPSSDGYSSSSHSSDSKGRKDRSRASDSEAGEQRAKGEREWQEALQQHQRRPLRSLYEMSNLLVKHLGSFESATGDMVTEYTEGGTRLIEGINEAHAEDRTMLVAKHRHTKQTLEGQLGELTLGLDKTSKGVKKHCVAEMQKVSNSEEQERQSQLEAAIGAHEN